MNVESDQDDKGDEKKSQAGISSLPPSRSGVTQSPDKIPIHNTFYLECLHSFLGAHAPRDFPRAKS